MLDEPCGQRRAFALGDHPPHDVSAEDVDQDVEVEVRPAPRPQKPRDVPRPGLVRRDGDEFGLGVLRMGELVTPFAHRLLRGQDAIHRALRAQVLPFIEQRRDDLRGRAVDEAWAGEHVEDVLTFRFPKCPGGLAAGLLAPGSGPLTPIEGRPGHTQRSARRRDADVRCERGGCHQQSFPSLRLNPSSPATFPWTSRMVCAVASSFSSRATFASRWRTELYRVYRRVYDLRGESDESRRHAARAGERRCPRARGAVPADPALVGGPVRRRGIRAGVPVAPAPASGPRARMRARSGPRSLADMAGDSRPTRSPVLTEQHPSKTGRIPSGR